jgi:hypothetical protein
VLGLLPEEGDLEGILRQRLKTWSRIPARVASYLAVQPAPLGVDYAASTGTQQADPLRCRANRRRRVCEVRWSPRPELSILPSGACRSASGGAADDRCGRGG